MHTALRPEVRLLGQTEGRASLTLAAATRVHRDMDKYPSYECYLALADGEPIGTFTLLVFPTFVHERWKQALVGDVHVARGWRGRGIGGAMMGEAMRLAAHAGCHCLAIASAPPSEDLQRFYRSLGFRQHGASFCIDIVPLGNPMRAVRELVEPHCNFPVTHVPYTGRFDHDPTVNTCGSDLRNSYLRRSLWRRRRSRRPPS